MRALTRNSIDISPRQLKRFKRIYRAQFGEDLPDEKARDAANQLVAMMKIVFDIR